MRAAAFFWVVAGCATVTVGDLPADRPPAPGAALLAGQLDFSGSPIAPELVLRSEEGQEVTIEAGPGPFLVAVPPGRYGVRRFGAYRPRADELTLEAVSGEAIYVGSFWVERNGERELSVVVGGGIEEVTKALLARYDVYLPPLRSGVVQSAAAPFDPAREELVIAVERAPSGSPTLFFGYGAGYGSYYYGYGHLHWGDVPLAYAGR